MKGSRQDSIGESLEAQLAPTAEVAVLNDVGIVVVARNEGERLRRCLNSIVGLGLPVVYVDGNSTDGSVELAQSLGADVVKEDPAQRNCTARAETLVLIGCTSAIPESDLFSFSMVTVRWSRVGWGEGDVF